LVKNVFAGLVAGAVVLTALSAFPATAQQRPPRTGPSPSGQPATLPSAPPETPDAVTRHSVTVDGKAIDYTARAGTITLRNELEQPTARIFYTAYTVDAEATARPVTFIYNGGPGSSTMWLRMGSFGPVRVLAGDGKPTGPPPYRIVDNPYSLLDKSDLVFIDMPSSGFGRIVGAGKPRDFYGVDQDVSAFAQFITRYITAFNRWNSPKFLFGESYGTTRSAALSSVLQRQGIALNGIILLSSILNFGLDYGNGDPIAGGDWAYVFYLPSEAATAWYHNKVPNKPDLRSYLARVEHFALNDYADALAQGDRLSASRRNAIVHALSGYLGLSERFIRNANLRVTYSRFQKELLRSDGIVIGRLDARYQTYDLDSATERSFWDPTESSIGAPYTVAVNQYLRGDLKYDTPLQYRSSVYALIRANGGNWDETHNRRAPTNVAGDLADTMTQNPSLKVFSANGYYDLRRSTRLSICRSRRPCKRTSPSATTRRGT